MAILTLTTVIIDFAGANPPPAEQPVGTLYRLVETRESQARSFALFKNNQRIRQLTPDEIDRLDHLLSHLAIRAPWQALMGLDGSTHTLQLNGLMSGVTFHWWVEAPKGWEGVGKVFDYVLSLAPNR
jgi:hypothetical protein